MNNNWIGCGKDRNGDRSNAVCRSHRHSIAFGVLAVLLCFASSAQAALPTVFDWKFAGWSGGGAFPQIFPSSVRSGEVWVVSDVAGVFKSDDHGDQWVWSTQGMSNVGGSTIVQAPSNPMVFYHASGRRTYDGAIHRSNDGGRTWSVLAKGSVYRVDIGGHRALAVDRQNENVAYLGNVNGDLYRTTDGANWTLWKSASQVGLGKISAMVVDATNAYLWVGSASGLVRVTLADGQVVLRTLTGTNGTSNRDIVAATVGGTPYVFVGAGNAVAYSADHGLNWSYTTALPISSSNTINRIAVAPGAAIGSTRIMAAFTTLSFSMSGGLYKSSNGGSSWTGGFGAIVNSVQDNGTRTWHKRNSGQLVLTLAVDPFDPNRWWIADFWGIFRTDDFGGTWNEKVKGAGNTVISDVRIAPNGDVLAVAMDNGLLKSVDGGLTWTALIPNTTPGQGYPDVAGHFWKVVTSGSKADWQAGRGHIIATSWAWDSSVKHKILRSVDNGATWTVITNAGIPNIALSGGVWGDGYARSMDYTAGKILVGLDGYSGNVNGGVFESVDDGLTWRRLTANPQPTTNYGNDWKIYNGLARNPVDAQNIIYGTFNGAGIKYSLDGGATWQGPSSGNQFYVYDIKFGPDGTAYSASETGGDPTVYRSTDKGRTWSLIWRGGAEFGAADAIEVDPNNPDRLVFSTTNPSSTGLNQVYITENARAATPVYTNITGNLPSGQGMASCAFRYVDGEGATLFCGRYAGGVFKMALFDAATPPPADTAAPTVPANFTAILSGSSIQMSWSASSDNVGVTGYRILDGATPIATTTGTSYSMAQAVPGSVYDLSVRAYDASGNESAPSSVVSVTVTSAPPADTTAPTAPALSGSLSGSQVSLSWTGATDDTGVTGYKVYSGSTLLATVAAASYNAAVVPGSSYLFTVKAEDAAGNLSASSNAYSVAVPALEGPQPPANFNAAHANGRVRLTWSRVDTATSYTVYRDGSYWQMFTTSDVYDSGVSAGSTYAYKVRANLPNNVKTAFTNELTVAIPGGASDASAPSVPEGLRATVAGSQISLVWNASVDNVAVTGYRVFNGISLLGTAASTVFEFASASVGITYSLAVEAFDAAGNSSPRSVPEVVTVADTEPPSAPTGLTASREAMGITIRWNSSSDNAAVAGYKVFDGASLLASVDTEQFTVSPAQEGRTYSFTVMAFDMAGNESVPSAPLAYQMPVPPAVPQNFIAFLSGTDVHLSWSAGAGPAPAVYEIARDQAVIGSTGSLFWDDASPVAGSSHAYQVRALDAQANASTWSEPMTVSIPAPDTQAPSVPAGLSASRTNDRIDLSWSASSDDTAVAAYRVFSGKDLIATVSDTTTVLDNITPSKTYAFTVVAVDAAGNASLPSGVLYHTVPSDIVPPSSPVLSVTVTGSSARLSWTASTDNVAVKGYNVYRNDQYLLTMTTRSYTDKSAPSGAVRYSIKAYDGSRNSSMSNDAVVTVR